MVGKNLKIDCSNLETLRFPICRCLRVHQRNHFGRIGLHAILLGKCIRIDWFWLGFVWILGGLDLISRPLVGVAVHFCANFGQPLIHLLLNYARVRSCGGFRLAPSQGDDIRALLRRCSTYRPFSSQLRRRPLICSSSFAASFLVALASSAFPGRSLVLGSFVFLFLLCGFFAARLRLAVGNLLGSVFCSGC